MFSFSSTTLGIKRAAIHIGITDAKGSSESLILLLIQFCQLVSLSYPRGEEVKGLKEINNKMQSHIHTITGMDLTATRKGRQEHETVHSKEKEQQTLKRVRRKCRGKHSRWPLPWVLLLPPRVHILLQQHESKGRHFFLNLLFLVPEEQKPSGLEPA